MNNANQTDFERDLSELINRNSLENGSNTPDFILASYMAASLAAFNKAVFSRDCWYGKELAPGRDSTKPEDPAALSAREES